MKTLAIETSCDDTSLGIIEEKDGVFHVEKLVAYSQIQEHLPYGGVLPEIASRLHSEKIVKLLETIGKDAIEQVDFISVTNTPWLPGSLIVGRTAANFLSAWFGKPLKKIHHILGHLFSLLVERKEEDLTFPMVVLTASWGHNDLYLVQKERIPWKIHEQQLNDLRIYQIWYTLDDASGEAFDKVSKMLWGPYPWGPRISAQAKESQGNPRYHFKRIFLPIHDDMFEFSFSGMKSQVSFLLGKMEQEGKVLTDQDKKDLAYEFQEAVVETLWRRLMKAAKLYHATTIGIAWGVSANERLREFVQGEVIKYTQEEQKSDPTFKVQFLTPLKNVYSTDNAAMIGVVGLMMKA